MIRIVTSSGVDVVVEIMLSSSSSTLSHAGLVSPVSFWIFLMDNFIFRLFSFLFRFEYLRDSAALPQWRHLREYQPGPISVQVSRRIFRHQLRGGGQRLRHGSLPSRRHLYRYNQRRDQWHQRQHRRRRRIIQLHLPARMDWRHLPNQ